MTFHQQLSAKQLFNKYAANPFIFFFISAIVFFWPVSLFISTLKNDALTYYYPVRTLISDALHQGELPLWTPFINMGYPLHADMQSGAWNPVIWLFSFISNYSLAGFHCELLFYITFAGIGFYYLCRNFGCSKVASYTIGIAYQFSGFMTDSVQFFNCISAACYIPWIFLLFRKLITEYRVSDSLWLSVVLFLLFTGGYPSLFIITTYVLIAYALFIFFSTTKKRFFLKKALPTFFITAFVFILLSLPAIISFIQNLDLIGRGKSQLLSVVLENSLNPSCSLSLLIPFATAANDNWLHSQIIMRSIYIGIIPLLFVISFLFNSRLKKNKEVIFFFVMALLMLGFAWGKFFFLRQAAYYTLPLMDSFRHPALFRFFTVFFFLLIAAASLKEWRYENQSTRLFFKRIIKALFVTVSLAFFLAIVLEFTGNSEVSKGMVKMKEFFFSSRFQQRFLIQVPFLLLSLALAYFALVQRKSARLILLVVVTDLFFATQLSMPVTVIGAKSFNEVKKLINRNPKLFPVPDNQPIEQHIISSSGEKVITGSVLPFTKKIGRNDYFITPGNLSLQDSFYESPYRNEVFKNPVIFFADTIFHSVSGKADFTRGMIFSGKHTGNHDSGNIMINSFSANDIKLTVKNQRGGVLLYLQNNYPGWQAFSDEKKIEIITADITFMSIIVQPGQHQIHFRYYPKKIIIAWYISVVTFCLMVLLQLIFFFKKRDQGNTKREPDEFTEHQFYPENLLQ